MELAIRPNGIMIIGDLVDSVLADKRSENTKRAYRADLVDFFGKNPASEDIQRFLTQDAAGMAFTLNAHKADMLRRGLSEATVNRRLAAVKSLLKYARRVGACTVDPRGLVDNEKTRSYRDTSGIGVGEVEELLSIPDTATIKGKRDAAILLLLCENGLRRSEVCSLDVQHFWPTETRLYIRGKGRGTEKDAITLQEKTCAAILDYLAATDRAGSTEGALFLTCDRRGQATRLTPEGLHHIVMTLGRKAGLTRRLTPHKLRHSGATNLGRKTRQTLTVQAWGRWKDGTVALRYMDNLRELQAEATATLAGLYGQ